MLSKDKFQRELGKRIREIRERKGISLKELEFRENAPERSEISKIENGLKAPNSYTLYRIATILEVDLAEFFKSND